MLLLATQATALTIYKYTDANGVVTYTDKAAAGAQVFVFRDRMVERIQQQVTLETKMHDPGETPPARGGARSVGAGLCPRRGRH